MSLLFQNATGLTSLTGLENWDVQKVTNMTRIFNNVNKVTKLSPLSNWKTDSLLCIEVALLVSKLLASKLVKFVSFWNVLFKETIITN